MKTIRRIILICALVIAAMICCISIAYADDSGNCGYYGQNVTWHYYDSSKTLRISGSGLMTEDYIKNGLIPPWKQRNYEIRKVIIDSGVTSVGSYSFWGSDSLTSVSLPNSVLIIGDGAFYDCSSLSSISLPANLLGIGNQAFLCCNISRITLPSKVQYIGSDAFSSCNLTSITLNEGLKEIGDYAFDGCSGLTSVTIPKTVKYLGYEPFVDCDNLRSIYLYCGVPLDDCNSFSDYEENIYYYDKSWTLNARNRWGKYATWTLCHEWENNYTIDKKPNCVKSGTKSRHCKYCNEKKDVTAIPATGVHDLYLVKVTKKPTCQSTGKQLLHCSNCDYQTTEVLPINPNNHVFNNGKVIRKASRTANGLKKCTCQSCKYKKEVVINKANNLKLSATEYTFNGKKRKPRVIIKDSKGKTISSANYTLINKGGKNVGTYTAKVSFKKEYKGTWKKSFKIRPRATWFRSVKSQDYGFKVKWAKKTKQVSGYQIQYSRKASFAKKKTINIKSNKTISKTVKNLIGGKKYYVRVRTYKTVNGKKYFSKWSAKKRVKAKKPALKKYIQGKWKNVNDSDELLIIKGSYAKFFRSSLGFYFMPRGLKVVGKSKIRATILSSGDYEIWKVTSTGRMKNEEGVFRKIQ